MCRGFEEDPFNGTSIIPQEFTVQSNRFLLIEVYINSKLVDCYLRRQRKSVTQSDKAIDSRQLTD